LPAPGQCGRMILRLISCAFAPFPARIEHARKSFAHAGAPASRARAGPGLWYCRCACGLGPCAIGVAACLGQAGQDRAEALRLSNRAAMLDGDNPTVLPARAAVHTMAAQHGLASELAARALARSPRMGWAWERRGGLRAYAGDTAGVLTCFGRSLRLDPATPSKAARFSGIGGGFFNVGRYDLAANWLRRAWEAEPDARPSRFRHELQGRPS